MRLRSGDKHHLRKSADRKAQISPVSGTSVFLICAFRSADFLRWCLSPERNLTHNLFFLFPIVFGINLIHFFDEKKDGAAGYSIVCFGASIPCHAIWQKRRRTRTVSKSATYLATESVNSAPFKMGVRERGGNFSQGNVQNSSPILRCTFLARKSAKLIANFSATKVTSLPSLSLSLSLSFSLYLSLSPSIHHAQYRKRFRASYNKSQWSTRTFFFFF